MVNYFSFANIEYDIINTNLWQISFQIYQNHISPGKHVFLSFTSRIIFKRFLVTGVYLVVTNHVIKI